MEIAGLGLDVVTVRSITSESALVVLPLALLPVFMRKGAAALLVSFFSLLIFADILYRRYFGIPVPFWSLAEAHQLIEWRESVYGIVSLRDMVLLFFPLGILLFVLGYKNSIRFQRPLGGLRIICRYIFIFLVFLAIGLPSIRLLYSNMHDYSNRDRVCREGLFLQRWGVLNNHLFDLLRLIRESCLRSRLSPDAERKLRAFFEKRAEGAKDAGTFGLARGKNLLLIQVESLEQFVIGKKINGQEVTPFLNRLSEEALYYPYIFDQTADGTSSDADFCVLNSLHPLNRGAVVFRRPYNHFVALPRLLKDAGYTTFSAQAIVRDTWNMAVVYPRYGIEHSLFLEEMGEGELLGRRFADHIFLSRMVRDLEKLRRPFFAFLATIISHYPFDNIPDEYKSLDLGKIEGTMLGDYLHCMYYEDKCIGQFLRDLKSAGLLKDTVVVIYGDHRARLPVNADLLQFAVPDAEALSEQMLEAGLSRVPLFIRIPGDNPKGIMPVVGGHVDIAPTLLHLLGIERPRCFIGNSLIGTGPKTAVLSQPLMSKVSDGRVLMPNRGRCLEFPSGKPLSIRACEDLSFSAREELDTSRAVILHDLAREIKGGGD
ncbi:MAG: LTA synthase family protein [Candidatus Omnitrophica bacterium]|nr:LTA synthase family protein [Candidatus Omnitrophota bacterium]